MHSVQNEHPHWDIFVKFPILTSPRHNLHVKFNCGIDLSTDIGDISLSIIGTKPLLIFNEYFEPVATDNRLEQREHVPTELKFRSRFKGFIGSKLFDTDCESAITVLHFLKLDSCSGELLFVV
jgi:hypothetical protein